MRDLDYAALAGTIDVLPGLAAPSTDLITAPRHRPDDIDGFVARNVGQLRTMVGHILDPKSP